MPPSQSYKRRCVACQHFPDHQTLRLQTGAGEDIINLPSGLDRVQKTANAKKKNLCVIIVNWLHCFHVWSHSSCHKRSCVSLHICKVLCKIIGDMSAKHIPFTQKHYHTLSLSPKILKHTGMEENSSLQDLLWGLLEWFQVALHMTLTVQESFSQRIEKVMVNWKVCLIKWKFCHRATHTLTISLNAANSCYLVFMTNGFKVDHALFSILLSSWGDVQIDWVQNTTS